MYRDGNQQYGWDKNGDMVGKSSPLAKKPFEGYDKYDFFKTGHTYRNNFSISSGTENSSLRISYSNLKQDGIIPNTGITRNTLSAVSYTHLTLPTKRIV